MKVSFTENCIYFHFCLCFFLSRITVKKKWSRVFLPVSVSSACVIQLFAKYVPVQQCVSLDRDGHSVLDACEALANYSVSLQHIALIKPPFPFITLSTDHAYIQKHASDLSHFHSLSACNSHSHCMSLWWQADHLPTGATSCLSTINHFSLGLTERHFLCSAYS